MSTPAGSYLPKLRAVRDLIGAASAHNVARYLDVGYETARNALRRLETAGYLTSVRDPKSWRSKPEVTYKLTAKGAEALASRREPVGVPTGSQYSKTVQVARGEASTGVNPAWDWRELHAALGMGDARVPKRARKVLFALDSEPVGWRCGA